MPVTRGDGWAAKVPRMTRRAPDHALEYKEYLAWDASTRWFHWINTLAVLGLIGTGLGVLNDDALGLSAWRQNLAEEHPCAVRLCDGGQSSLAVHLGVLWQPLFTLARHLAGWPWLFRGLTRLRGVVFVRRTATICGP